MTSIALVTGANKGIGFATAKLLADRGWTVLAGARDTGRGRHAAAQLRAGGADARFVRLDVTDVHLARLPDDGPTGQLWGYLWTRGGEEAYGTLPW
jgi:NAD(P)-dependent dehydrogenase (short-subunit alcohol dehydrogenase family)